MHKKTTTIIGWLICILGATFYCYEYLLRIEPSVMVTELLTHFHLTAAGFGFVAAFYYYVYTPMQLVVGMLVDRYGTRITIGSAIIVCTLGSLLFSMATTVYAAALARALIGLGSAFAFVGVLKLATEWLPKHHFALFVGCTTALGMFGGMVGDMDLTTMVHKIGWENTLYFGTIIGLLLMPLIFLFIHDTPYWRKSHTGYKLVAGFQETFTGLKNIIKNPQMWLCGILGGALFLSLSAFAELWGIKFLETVYSLASKQAGVACAMVFAGWLVGAPLNGWVSDLLKSRKIPLLIGGFLSAAVISVIIIKPFAMSFYLLCGLLFLFGIFSSLQVLCFAISKESNPHHLAATAIAFTNLLVMLSGIIFQPLLGALLDFNWSGHLLNQVRIYSVLDYQKAFAIIPISIFLGALCIFKLKETLSSSREDNISDLANVK